MADLQSTNRTALAKVREVTFGVTPATPAFKAIRNTSSSLNANPRTIISEEIRADRQVTDLILVGLSAGGDIGGELSFLAHDDDFEEALQGTWSNQASITVVTTDIEISDMTATTITVSAGGTNFKLGMLASTTGFTTAANNKVARVASSTGTTIVFPASTYTIEAAPIPVGASVKQVGFQGAAADIVATITGGNALTSTVLDFTTMGISPGEWVKIGGSVVGEQFATAANNGYARVSAVTATRLSFSIVPTGWSADTGTGKTISVFTGDFLSNASTKRSNTIERQYLDHAPVSYEYLRGMTLDSLLISLNQQAIVQLTKTYTGKDAVIQTTRFAGATDVASPTYDVMNTTADVGDLSIDGVTVTGPNFIMAATFQINNNIRQQTGIGSLGAVGTGNGEFNVTGTLNTYFGDKTIYDKVLANTLTSVSCRVGATDVNKPSYLIDCPSIKYSAGAPGITGKNQDIMITGTYQAFMHATLLFTMSITRFWYLP